MSHLGYRSVHLQRKKDDIDFEKANDSWSPLIYLVVHGFGNGTSLFEEVIADRFGIQRGAQVRLTDFDWEVPIPETDLQTGLMKGFTLLHTAIVYSGPSMVKCLLQLGSNPLRNDNVFGATSAHCAVVRREMRRCARCYMLPRARGLDHPLYSSVP